MNPVDDLIGPHDTAITEHDVPMPDFRDVRRRGNRLRRRRHGLVAGTATAVVVIALTGLTQTPTDHDATRPAAPVPHTPSLIPLPDGPPPSEELDRGVLTSVVTSPDDPNLHVGTWNKNGRYTLVVADPGTVYLTDRAGDSAPLVTAAGSGAFQVIWEDGTHVLIAAGVSERAVTVDDRVAPASATEVVVPGATPGTFLALDTATAMAHPLPVADGMQSLVPQPDGTLVGIARNGSATNVVWSRDRGATWQTHLVTDDASMLVQVLPSAAAGVFAVVESPDGATLNALSRVHRSSNGGRTWQTFDHGRNAPHFGAAGVMPDGRLLVDVVAPLDAATPELLGLRASRDDDWSELDPVPAGDAPPLPRGQLQSSRQITMTPTKDALLVVQLDPEWGTTMLSTNGGRGWEAFGVG